MDSRTRVIKALNCQEPDKVPILELLINDSSLIALANRFENVNLNVDYEESGIGQVHQDILELYVNIVHELELDATCYNFSLGLQPISSYKAKDKYERVYSLSEHGQPMPIAGPIKSQKDLKNLNMTSELDEEDFHSLHFISDTLGQNIAHFLIISDPFKVSWRSMGGMQNLLMEYLKRPNLVHSLAEVVTEFDIAVMEMAQKVIPNLDGIFLVGDLAGETGLIMSPDHYREFIKPYEEKVTKHAQNNSLNVIKHTDGDIWPIIDDFIEIGFDGFHPVQPQCMNISEVKSDLNNQVCVIGNIDCRNLLPYGAREEVIESTKKTIQEVAGEGGYIISSSNSIHPDVDPDNYIAMVETAHRYGSYNTGQNQLS